MERDRPQGSRKLFRAVRGDEPFVEPPREHAYHAFCDPGHGLPLALDRGLIKKGERPVCVLPGAVHLFGIAGDESKVGEGADLLHEAVRLSAELQGLFQKRE